MLYHAGIEGGLDNLGVRLSIYDVLIMWIDERMCFPPSVSMLFSVSAHWD